jgi:hypothetical protein
MAAKFFHTDRSGRMTDSQTERRRFVRFEIIMAAFFLTPEVVCTGFAVRGHG